MAELERTMRETPREDSPRVIQKTVTGKHGWTAEIRVGPAHLMPEHLELAADWWLETVREAVTNCPEPDNARRQSKNIRGLPKTGRKVREDFSSTSDIKLPSGAWRPDQIQATMKFDGAAASTDIIWPFSLHTVTSQLIRAIGDTVRNAWNPFHSTRAPRRKRIFEDFSGLTAEERQVHLKPQPAPLKPSAIWTVKTHQICQPICTGEYCTYGPAEKRWMLSGCNQIWKQHSLDVFQAFRDANPELQYKDDQACVMETEEKRHVCNRRNHGELRGEPLGHDEICRFPNGDKLIISHPYMREDQDYACTLSEWKAGMSDIAIRNGGEERSWYFPRHSSLLLIGRSCVLDRVNLDYPVPAQNEPTECRRWWPARSQTATSRVDD